MMFVLQPYGLFQPSGRPAGVAWSARSELDNETAPTGFLHETQWRLSDLTHVQEWSQKTEDKNNVRLSLSVQRETLTLTSMF